MRAPIFLLAGIAAAVSFAGGADSPTNGVVAVGGPAGIAVDAGAKLAVREEVSHDVPCNPGGGQRVNKSVSRTRGTHLMRFDSHVWMRADTERFTLFADIANRSMAHFRTNGQRKDDRTWQFPDELSLDDLYLEGRGLFDDLIDFRLGRQDLSDGVKSYFGLERLLMDGTPSDYSRSYYSDMARFTLHPMPEDDFDFFALYDTDDNPLSWGRQRVHGRSQNYLTGNDLYGPDQWGGGAIWSSRRLGKGMPFKAYALFKRDSAYRRGDVHVPTKDVATGGVLFTPAITDELALELEGAGQTGSRHGWGSAGGWMGVAGFDWHPRTVDFADTYLKLTQICFSGDKDNGDGHGDNAWDPMWARYTWFSEVFARGTHPQVVYWSNMLFTKVTAGMKFGPKHSLEVFSGPIWAAADDELGGGSGTFKGVLSKVRYNFPLLLRPKNARGMKRFEVFGHFMLEAFNPGEYYESSKPAIYARWQLNFVF